MPTDPLSLEIKTSLLYRQTERSLKFTHGMTTSQILYSSSKPLSKETSQPLPLEKPLPSAVHVGNVTYTRRPSPQAPQNKSV